MKNGGIQRDLGILVHKSLRVNVQVKQIIRKVNSVLTFNARGFGCMWKNTTKLSRILMNCH